LAFALSTFVILGLDPRIHAGTVPAAQYGAVTAKN